MCKDQGVEYRTSDQLKHRNLNVVLVTETKKKLRCMNHVNVYEIICSGMYQNIRVWCGVAIFIDKKWKKKSVGYSFINKWLVVV